MERKETRVDRLYIVNFQNGRELYVSATSFAEAEGIAKDYAYGTHLAESSIQSLALGVPIHP